MKWILAEDKTLYNLTNVNKIFIEGFESGIFDLCITFADGAKCILITFKNEEDAKKKLTEVFAFVGSDKGKYDVVEPFKKPLSSTTYGKTYSEETF